MKLQIAEGDDFLKIDRFLATHESVLKKIYQVCCRGRAGIMNLETTIRFLGQKEGLNLTKSQAVKCFAMTKLPVVDEKGDGLGNNSMYNRVNFAEFQEIIIRAGVMRFEAIRNVDPKYHRELSLFDILKKTLEVIIDDQADKSLVEKYNRKIYEDENLGATSRQSSY